MKSTVSVENFVEWVCGKIFFVRNKDKYTQNFPKFFGTIQVRKYPKWNFCFVGFIITQIQNNNNEQFHLVFQLFNWFSWDPRKTTNTRFYLSFENRTPGETRENRYIHTERRIKSENIYVSGIKISSLNNFKAPECFQIISDKTKNLVGFAAIKHRHNNRTQLMINFQCRHTRIR